MVFIGLLYRIGRRDLHQYMYITIAYVATSKIYFGRIQ